MDIIGLSVRNGTAVVVGMILTLLFGFIAFDRIPIQMNPTIDRPIISVETEYPGAAPLEVESEIAQRIEQRLAAVEDLRKIRSYSREGEANVILEFEWGTNKDVAMIDVVKRLESVQNLPEDVEESQIENVDSEDERSILRLTIDSERPVNEVRELLEDRIGPQLERVPGVGTVRWYGGSRREIQVLLDLAALNSRDVSISEVLQAISRENQTTRGGKIESARTRTLVRTVGQYTDLDEIRNTVVKKLPDGGVIRVADLGEVVDSFHETEGIGRTGGKPAINMGISKKSGTNTLEVAEAAREEVERINKELAPMGIRFWVTYDASEYIWDSIYGVRNDLLFGASLAVFILLIFLRSISATFIVAITIPLCLIGTFVLLAAFGRSVNVISLAGLGFAAGMVVDDGIVAIENIVRHRVEYGTDRFQAARDASYEVWAPILAATLTTLAVFIPILFIQEEAGQLFRDIAASISFAVGLSLIAAITVIPMLSSRLIRKVPRLMVVELSNDDIRKGDDQPAEAKRSRDPFVAFGSMVSGFFLWLVGLGIRFKTLRFCVIGLIIAGFFVSLKLVPPAEYLPESRTGMLFGNMSFPSGMSLEGADRQVRKIEEYVLKDQDNYTRVFFVTRRERSFFGIFLKRDYATHENTQKVLDDVTAYAQSVLPSDVRFNLFEQSDFGWSGEGKGVSIDVSGPDLEVLRELNDELENTLRTMPGVMSVRSSLNIANPELQVHPDRERLADLGMTSRDLAIVVETLLEGTRASLYREAGKEYDLLVKARDGQILTPDQLGAVTINTPTGLDVRLDELADVRRDLGPVSIEHLEQERVISLNVSFDEEIALQTFIQRVEEEVLEPYRATIPPSYRLEMSGSADDLERTMNALGSSFLLALLIIYLLQSALFESFFYPFIIMFTIPLAMTGGLLGIWALDAKFDVITMLGFILLAGIVTKNGILLIDFALNRFRSGQAVSDAILGAIKVRMRPIFMTSATTVIGALPLALGKGHGAELYGGLGATIVGGMSLSTIFTIVLIPLILATALEFRVWIYEKLGFGKEAKIPATETVPAAKSE